MCERIIYVMICTMLIFAACEKEYTENNNEQIVVEGWIESGSGPVVMLTKSFTINTGEVSYEEDESIVLPWGKVTVSDGTKSVVLTGDPNESYFPPYRYSTSKIRGVPGRTYYLFVEYGNRVLTAQTIRRRFAVALARLLFIQERGRCKNHVGVFFWVV